MITCICGCTFLAPARKTGTGKRYCSHRCAVAAWRAANPDKHAAIDARQDEKRRIRNALHPEISKAKEAARYAANSIGQRSRVAAYRSNPLVREHGNYVTAAWRAANPEKARVAVRRWEEAHPELKGHYHAAWRARKRGNGGSHTLTEWREKCALFDNRCAYCGEEKPLTRDHDIPLSRGGTDDITNIIPACRLCNSKKRTRTAVEFNALLRIA
jgi:5-methylcytosine-specific restriction endonuclease McrA